MNSSKSQNQNGYSLLELIITMTVMAVLVLGTVPLVQNTIKRQKELELREALRMMRSAIDEFKRDTLGACPQGANNSSNPIDPSGRGQNIPTDPRSRVVIDDCKIFDTENLDRFPPTLEVLAEGVKVKSRMPASLQGGQGISGDSKNATELNETKEVTKVYLREIPTDPFTGEKEWNFRSSYQGKDSDSWDEVNVFDVHSTAEGESLNGEKYSDW